MISPRILWGVVSLAGACLLSGCATSPAEKPRPQDDASSSTPDIRAAAELPEYPLVQADDVLFLDDALPADAAIFFVLEDRSFLAVGGEEHPIELRGPKSEGEGRGSWAYYHRNKKALSEAYKSLGLETGSPEKPESDKGSTKTLYFWFTPGARYEDMELVIRAALYTGLRVRILGQKSSGEVGVLRFVGLWEPGFKNEPGCRFLRLYTDGNSVCLMHQKDQFTSTVSINPNSRENSREMTLAEHRALMSSGVLDTLCPRLDIFPMASVNAATIMSFASSYSPVLKAESRISLFMFRGESSPGAVTSVVCEADAHMDFSSLVTSP